MSDVKDLVNDRTELGSMALDDARIAATLTLGMEDEEIASRTVDDAMIEDEDNTDELCAASLDEMIADEDT